MSQYVQNRNVNTTLEKKIIQNYNIFQVFCNLQTFLIDYFFYIIYKII